MVQGRLSLRGGIDAQHHPQLQEGTVRTRPRLQKTPRPLGDSWRVWAEAQTGPDRGCGRAGGYRQGSGTDSRLWAGRKEPRAQPQSKTTQRGETQSHGQNPRALGKGSEVGGAGATLPHLESSSGPWSA